MRVRLITPVAGSNLLSKKSLDSPNSPQNSNSKRLFQSKTSNLVKWTKLISADFSSNSTNFTTPQPRGLFLIDFFFEKCRSNIWGVCESTPQTLLQKDPQNSNSEESSENREILSSSRFDPATGVISVECRRERLHL